MAIDEWLLDRAVAGGGPVLRLYDWRRPTLSLGFHQRRIEPAWRALATAGRIDLVRRPTGGRAVLHAGSLTYALVWPAPAAARGCAYRLACAWLQEAFAGLGQPLVFGRRAATADRASCFAGGTAADLVHHDGAKRIGSAQLWRRGSLLQHGCILLNPPAELWRQLFAAAPPPLPPLPLDRDGLMLRLRRAAADALPMAGRLRSRPLSGLEWRRIALRRSRYRPLPLAAGTVSPAACIERATWERARPRG
jgi:lipoate-protein ligase A